MFLIWIKIVNFCFFRQFYILAWKSWFPSIVVSVISCGQATKVWCVHLRTPSPYSINQTSRWRSPSINQNIPSTVIYSLCHLLIPLVFSRCGPSQTETNKKKIVAINVVSITADSLLLLESCVICYCRKTWIVYTVTDRHSHEKYVQFRLVFLCVLVSMGIAFTEVDSTV